MRGKFLHNKVIIAALLCALSLLGYQVFLEHPTRSGQRPPCVDAFVVVREKRIVFEAECSPARIGNDLAKAREIGAHLLLIIVPNARLRGQVRAALRPMTRDYGRGLLQVQILTLGAALRWISKHCPPVAARPAADGLNQPPHNNKH